MKIRNAMITFFLLLYFSHAQSVSPKKNVTADTKKVMCITIPKTGTHLLQKCLALMDVEKLGFDYTKSSGPGCVKNLKKPFPADFMRYFFKPSVQVLHKHLYYSPEAEEFFDKHTKANFLMIRDPRAQLVSLAYSSKKNRNGIKDRSVEDVLLDFLLARHENFAHMSNYVQRIVPTKNKALFMIDFMWTRGAANFFNLYIPWMKAKKFYTVKFENLIGPAGGGTLEAQYLEIKNIAQHLGMTLSDEKIAYVMENLFGGTSTFREGRSDGWKKHFTPAVKEAFKSNQSLMQLVVDLGYEKDFNWILSNS